MIAAAEQAGIPRNNDFNGARQEGAGYYQIDHQRRPALVLGARLSGAGARAAEPHRPHLAARRRGC